MSNRTNKPTAPCLSTTIGQELENLLEAVESFLAISRKNLAIVIPSVEQLDTPS